MLEFDHPSYYDGGATGFGARDANPYLAHEIGACVAFSPREAARVLLGRARHEARISRQLPNAHSRREFHDAAVILRRAARQVATLPRADAAVARALARVFEQERHRQPRDTRPHTAWGTASAVVALTLTSRPITDWADVRSSKMVPADVGSWIQRVALSRIADVGARRLRGGLPRRRRGGAPRTTATSHHPCADGVMLLAVAEWGADAWRHLNDNSSAVTAQPRGGPPEFVDPATGRACPPR